MNDIPITRKQCPPLPPVRTSTGKPVLSPLTDLPEEPNFASMMVVAWTGTAIAGGVFGLTVSLLASVLAPPALILGIVAATFGFLIAAVVGAVVIPTLAVLAWATFLDGRPRVIVMMGGGLTGLISGAMMGAFALIPAVFGAVGAVLAVQMTCSRNTSTANTNAPSYPDSKPTKPAPFRFTLSDLFARVTAVAILCGVWSLLLSLFK